jgi:hypothetical protein
MTFFILIFGLLILLEFKVKLVDFGANGVFGGGDDRA